MTDIRYHAVVADMDGVVTNTAEIHRRAWKSIFDSILERWKSTHPDLEVQPFSEADYLRYVGGKPRLDGARDFLASRGIELPPGHPDDSPDAETLYGVGKRKSQLFLDIVAREGAEYFEDAVERLRAWRDAGKQLAVVSASRNCAHVLRHTGLEQLFDVRVDGAVANAVGLDGKPDMFREAARRLGIDPMYCVALEDAQNGVNAAHRVHFGVVVGVARNRDNAKALYDAGADVVVSSLHGLDPDLVPPSALHRFREIADRLGPRLPVIFADYDGTLTPIVENPNAAVLSDEMRGVLQMLAMHWRVAVVSGRDLRDVERRVDLSALYYAGSHGFEIRGPDLYMAHEQAHAALSALDIAEQTLRERLAAIEGVIVERKQFGVAVHYRLAPTDTVGSIEQMVDDVLSQHAKLRKRHGKKVFELQPDIAWDKGKAVLWLCDALGVRIESSLPIYLGDDLTDEDAFAALKNLGVGIRVDPTVDGSTADYRLRDPEEVQYFLQRLLDLPLGQASSSGSGSGDQHAW